MSLTAIPGVIQAEPLTPRIGSVVSGVDFGDPASFASHAEAIRALLLERHVLFFRDIDLAPDAQVAFASIFGEPQPSGPLITHHPDSPYVEILHTKGKAIGTDVWHADRTWHATPPGVTCLYARQVPDVGGDTMWASMTAALDSLDPKLRDYLYSLESVHDWETDSNVSVLKSRTDRDHYAEYRQRHAPLVRPIIEKHPKNGAEILYVNALYTTRIIGAPPALADALLGYLTSLASVPEWQVRWHWAAGCMAVWDNWASQHYAVSDYYPHERIMHRVTVI